MTALDLDRTQGFAIPSRHARGRLVRLGATLDTILSAHAYPPAIEALLADALTLTALVGSTLKDDDAQLTMQARTDAGVVSLMVCDYRGGELRGYVQYDDAKLAEAPEQPTLFALFGKGYLAITFDLAQTGERYQGIVPLDGATLADAVEHYFLQSEQIPTLVRIATGRGRDGGHVAGGLFLQHLPEGEEGRERLHTRLDHPEWEQVAALGQTVADEELTDPTLPFATLLWRLFNEQEVRLLSGVSIARGCRCTPEHIAAVLAKFPDDERAAMAVDGVISVDCAFCAQSFPVPLDLAAA